MNTATITKTEYNKLSQVVTDLEMKFKILGTLNDFEKLTDWGRQFAEIKGFKPNLILEDD